MIKDNELSKRIMDFRNGTYDPEINNSGSSDKYDNNKTILKENNKSKIFDILISIFKNVYELSKFFVYGFSIVSIYTGSDNILSVLAIGITFYDLLEIFKYKLKH